MSEVAGARPVRDEDSFDVEAVATWLRAHAGDATGLDGTPEVRQFSGGASNLTYLLRYPTRDLILRRAGLTQIEPDQSPIRFVTVTAESL